MGESNGRTPNRSMTEAAPYFELSMSANVRSGVISAIDMGQSRQFDDVRATIACSIAAIRTSSNAIRSCPNMALFRNSGAAPLPASDRPSRNPCRRGMTART
jgi:hypothetical protein